MTKVRIAAVRAGQLEVGDDLVTDGVVTSIEKGLNGPGTVTIHTTKMTIHTKYLDYVKVFFKTVVEKS